MLEEIIYVGLGNGHNGPYSAIGVHVEIVINEIEHQIINIVTDGVCVPYRHDSLLPCDGMPASDGLVNESDLLVNFEVDSTGIAFVFQR